jgi:hypothetical protein
MHWFFFISRFLTKDLGELKFSYAQKPRQLPAVMTHEEALRVISKLNGRTKHSPKRHSEPGGYLAGGIN